MICLNAALDYSHIEHLNQSGRIESAFLRVNLMQGFDTGGESAGSKSVGCNPTLSDEYFVSLSGLLSKMTGRFEQLGWWVETGNESLTLHRKTEGEKPEKTYHISIYYEKYYSETYFQADESVDVGYQLVEVQSERQKPWMVKAIKRSTISFESFAEAAKKFLSVAEELAAVNNDNKR